MYQCGVISSRFVQRVIVCYLFWFWMVPNLASRSPFELVSMCFHMSPLLLYMLSSPLISCMLPFLLVRIVNFSAFTLETVILAPFSGKLFLESKSMFRMCSLLLGYCCSQALSVDRGRKYMYVCIRHTHMHLHLYFNIFIYWKPWVPPNTSNSNPTP